MAVTKFDLVFEFFKVSFWFTNLMQFIPKRFEQEDEIQTFTELHGQLERFAQRLLDLGMHYQSEAKPVKGRGKQVKQVKRVQKRISRLEE